MPRKPPPTIGECPCPQCGKLGEVRKGRQGIYGLCKFGCGSFKGQDFILENADIYGANPPPAPPPPAATGTGIAPVTIAPTRAPEPAPVPAEEPDGDSHRQMDFVDQDDTPPREESRGGFWPLGG